MTFVRPVAPPEPEYHPQPKHGPNVFMTGHNDDFGGSMIVGTERTKRREIGGRYTGLWVDGVLYDDQRFVVLREATFEEWIDGRSPEEWEPRLRCDPSEALFYEISVD